MSLDDHWTRRLRRRQERREAARRREIRQAQADAWIKGWKAGVDDQQAWRTGVPMTTLSTPNPYRDEQS